MIGILGYGGYLPSKWVDVAAADPRAVSLGLAQKRVAQWDEDSVTMGVEAALSAIKMSGKTAAHLRAVYMGSESPVYAVKPSAGLIADMLGVGVRAQIIDMEFACRAGVQAAVSMLGQIQAKQMDMGMVVVSDTAQAQQGDVLALAASSAAAAMVLGRGQNVLVELVAHESISSETPDFWRREREAYPLHGERFTGEPGYMRHVVEAGEMVLKKAGMNISDMKRVVTHMPNGKFPVQAMMRMGAQESQWRDGLIVDRIGNPYTASVWWGLMAALEVSKPDDYLLMVSYGSGAGSDGLIWRVTEGIRKVARTIRKQLNHKGLEVGL